MALKRTFTELTVEDIRQIFREELQNAKLEQQKASNGKRFHPIEWLVEYTGIPRSSIYQLTSKNLIPHIKRGRKLFFDAKKIDEWLEEGKVKTMKEINEDAERFLSERGRRMR